MKPRSRFQVVFLSLLTLSVLASGCRTEFAKWTLPTDWFLLPENGGPVPGENLTPASKALQEATHQLLLSNINSLAQAKGIPIHSNPHPQPWPPVPPDFVPWHLGAFVSNFTLSAGGVLGSLILAGSPSVRLIWESESASLPSSELKALSPGSRPRIRLNSRTRSPELKKQLEAAVKSGMATGIIRDEVALRKTLQESTGKLLGFGTILDTIPKTPAWQVSTLDLGIVVDASGNVASNVTAGASVTFRLEWQVEPGSANAELPGDLPARLKESLTEFVRNISQDFQVITQEARSFTDTNFKPTAFQLGVAFTAEGDIGLAHASGQLFGALTFQAADGTEALKPETKGHVPLLAPASNRNLADYARKEKIRHELRRTKAGGEPDMAVYEVDRGKFQKGLRHAVQIAEFFVRRAHEVNLDDWKVNDLDLAVDVSLSGTIGLTPVTQDGIIQLSFENAASKPQPHP